MEAILGIIFCFFPLLIFLTILISVFKIKATKVLLTILVAFVAILPISLLQFVILDTQFFSNNSIISVLIKSLIIYGFVEEALKAATFFLAPSKKLLKIESSQTPFPNFLLALLFGLTIGSFESLIYFFDNLAKTINNGGQLLYGLIFLRVFSSVIIHTACMGLSGLFIYSIRQHQPKWSLFIYPIILHGLYDFFACFQNSLRFFAIPVIILSIMECRIKYKSLSETE